MDFAGAARGKDLGRSKAQPRKALDLSLVFAAPLYGGERFDTEKKIAEWYSPLSRKGNNAELVSEKRTWGRC